MHNSKMNITITTGLLICSILLLSSTTTVLCRSIFEINETFDIKNYDFGTEAPAIEVERTKRCFVDEELLELCMRCAKGTKAVIAFPMCCNNEDDATNWCREFVYYGIQ